MSEHKEERKEEKQERKEEDQTLSDEALHEFWDLNEDEILALEVAGMKGDPDPGADQRREKS